MTRITLLIVLVFSGLFVQAQQANTSKGTRGLKFSFSAPALLAYQENAKTKIEDFYQYLQLLSDVSSSKELKKEVTANIFSLFQDKDVLIKDIISNSKNTIQLSSLINQITDIPSLKFEVGEIANQQVELDSWQTNYTVKISNGTKKSTLNLVQRVYLTKDLKTFGANSKEVWQMFLGPIE